MPAMQRTSGDDDVDIPPSLLNGVGVVALLAWSFWLLATGRIVTRREHENRIADKDAVIADKDAQNVMWRAAAETKDAQNLELLEGSRLSVQLLRAIADRAGASTGGDPQ